MKAPTPLSARLSRSLRRLQYPPRQQITTATNSPSLGFNFKSYREAASLQPSVRSFASTASFSASSGSFQTSPQADITSIRMILTPELLQGVRDLWFEHLSGPDAFILPGKEEVTRWFASDAALDKLCVERFTPALEALRASGIPSGQAILQALQPSDAHDWLSLVILLDQIPRNCYRGESSSIVFTLFDPLARDVALAAVERGIPHEWPQIRWRFAYRSWFYLPLMHSEDMAVHDMALREYERVVSDIESLIADHDDADGVVQEEEHRSRAIRVVRDRPEAARAYGQMNLGFEKRHWDIVRRFGRYPHRNKAMGRAHTKEEEAYLENGGETFGG